MKESEWKKFKLLRAKCLDRFCAGVLREAETICRSDNMSSHQRYGELYGLIEDRDKEMANAFDGPSRRKAIIQLMMMYRMGLVEEDELDEFESDTKDNIRDTVNLFRS